METRERAAKNFALKDPDHRKIVDEKNKDDVSKGEVQENRNFQSEKMFKSSSGVLCTTHPQRSSREKIFLTVSQ